MPCCLTVVLDHLQGISIEDCSQSTLMVDAVFPYSHRPSDNHTDTIPTKHENARIEVPDVEIVRASWQLSFLDNFSCHNIGLVHVHCDILRFIWIPVLIGDYVIDVLAIPCCPTKDKVLLWLELDRFVLQTLAVDVSHANAEAGSTPNHNFLVGDGKSEVVSVNTVLVIVRAWPEVKVLWYLWFFGDGKLYHFDRNLLIPEYQCPSQIVLQYCVGWNPNVRLFHEIDDRFSELGHHNFIEQVEFSRPDLVCSLFSDEGKTVVLETVDLIVRLFGK